MPSSRRFAPLVALLWGPAWAHAACDAPASRTAVGLATAEAQAAFVALEIERFNVAYDRVFGLVPCLIDPLLPNDVARVHTLVALAAFRDGDDEAGVNGWRSALAADPTFDLPDDLAPVGHPLRHQLDVARAMHGATMRPLGSIAPDLWLVDGHPAVESPLDRPALLQWQSADRQVKENAYLRPGQPLPSWVPSATPPLSAALVVPSELATLPAVVAVSTPVELPKLAGDAAAGVSLPMSVTPSEAQAARPRGRGWVAAAASGLTLGAVGVGAGFALERQLEASLTTGEWSELPLEERKVNADQRATQINALYGASYGLLAVGAVGGLGVVFTGVF